MRGTTRRCSATARAGRSGPRGTRAARTACPSGPAPGGRWQGGRRRRSCAGSRSASSRRATGRPGATRSRSRGPRSARYPGAKLSTSTSAVSTSSRRRSRSAGESRSSTTLRLPRLVTTDPTYDRCGSPLGGSTFTTSAPWSPSIMVASGPASPVVRSTILQTFERAGHRASWRSAVGRHCQMVDSARTPGGWGRRQRATVNRKHPPGVPPPLLTTAVSASATCRSPASPRSCVTASWRKP